MVKRPDNPVSKQENTVVIDFRKDLNELTERIKQLEADNKNLSYTLQEEIKRRAKLEQVLRMTFGLFQGVDVEMYRKWYDSGE